MVTMGVRVIRDKDGKRIGSEPASTSRVTKEVLGGMFGTDKQKRLVVSLCPGDVIEFRPEKTQRPETVKATDVYAWLLRSKALRSAREKQELKKVARKETLERRRIAAVDRRIRQQAKAQL